MRHTLTSHAGRLPVLVLLSTLLLAGPALAAAIYPNVAAARKDIPVKAQWYRQCQQVHYRRPLARDLPHARASGSCDAATLYHETQAMGVPSDAAWRAVRECAFHNNDNAVLMTLYANGAGVAPDLGLAMKYACSTAGSPTEMKNRLARLTQSRGHFDQCTGAAAGSRPGMCAGVREQQERKQRGDELAALAKGWTAKERLGYDMALQAARYFAQHRRDFETDLSGSARTRLKTEAEAAELERFAADVEDFENGKVPRLREAEFAVLDEKMNQAYKEFMDSAPGPDSYLGTIRKPDVEKTQRAWLAYRDAVELFASVKYPDVPPAAWRALLTSRRLRQLTELDNAALGK
jgi:uncharacterized protein YecT (DUF1311 family)